MSTSNLKILASKVPKTSLKGLAYLAAANFLARAIILLKHYILTSFRSEMILIYGATLDTRILLFFKAIYMIPMFLLGVLLFYGIDRESFNLVLYPTLMLVFLILIRYGSEAALLVIHWEDHKFDQTPELVFALLQDIIFIALLLLYVYVCLAFTPIKPTPLELIEGGNAAFVSAAQRNSKLIPENQQLSPIPLQQAVPPGPQPPQDLLSLPPNPILSVDPDSQGFNCSLRRIVDQIPKETLVETKPLLNELDRQKQKNTLIASASVGVKETDLDAVPTTSAAASIAVEAKPVEVKPVEVKPVEEPIAAVLEAPIAAVLEAPIAAVVEAPAAPEPEEPVVTVKLNKSRIAAARKRLAETSQSQKESTDSDKPAPESEADFWGSLNGEPTKAPDSSSNAADGFKTTSV